MESNKKLNLNKYAYLDHLKGDIFVWLTCNENFQKASKEDEKLRESAPWRYDSEEEKLNNKIFESEDADRYGFDLSNELPDQIKSGLRVGEYSELWAKSQKEWKNHEFVYINKQTNLENVEYTKEVLTRENVVVFEATFTYNEFVARTDILVKTGNEFKVIEVKGSTSPKFVYGYDLFYQKEIIERSNPEYAGWNYSLLLLDKRYIHSITSSPEKVASDVFINIDYMSNGNLKKRMHKNEYVTWDYDFNSVYERTLIDWVDEPKFDNPGRGKIFTFKIQQFFDSYFMKKESKAFDNKLERIKEIQLMDEPPKLEFEKRNNQFLNSDYMNWALDVSGAYDTEGHSIFDFKGKSVNFEDKCKFFKEGLKEMNQLSNSQIAPGSLTKEFDDIDKETPESIILRFLSAEYGTTVSKYATIIQRAYADKEESLLHRKSLDIELDIYKRSPIYMYDFETANLAIPAADGTKPYDQVVYQYSVHVILDANDYDFKTMKNVVHYEWLAQDRNNFHLEAWKEFIQIFKKHGEGVYVAWNKSFEKGCIRKAQTDLLNNEEIELLGRIGDETEDLMIPFKEKYYYHKDLKGSCSIKFVGPHFAEEINYKDLPLVQRGDQSAAVAKKWLRDNSEESDKEWLSVREGMLKYCEYDTLLMVAILQRVKERAND